MEDKAETWHTCSGYYPLKKLCFFFGRIRTLVDRVSIDLRIVSKVDLQWEKWKVAISVGSLGIFDIFTEM